METLININNYEENDSFYDMQIEDLACILDSKINYPVKLTAVASNWRGQTGVTEAFDYEELLNKISSFDSSNIELKEDEDGLYFRLHTHDVPTGFNVYIEELYDED